jgi:hypothetical protein
VFTYQWLRGGGAIGGATNPTYLLGDSDVGTTITCDVTASNINGENTAASNALGPVAGIAPSNTVPPVASGTAQVGQVLTCTPGTWTGSPPPVITYQWLRGLNIISGANSSTYALTPDEEGWMVGCVVTGTNSEGSDEAASNTIGPITQPSLIDFTQAPLNGTGLTVTPISGGWRVTVLTVSASQNWVSWPAPFLNQTLRLSFNFKGDFVSAAGLNAQLRIRTAAAQNLQSGALDVSILTLAAAAPVSKDSNWASSTVVHGYFGFRFDTAVLGESYDVTDLSVIENDLVPAFDFMDTPDVGAAAAIVALPDGWNLTQNTQAAYISWPVAIVASRQYRLEFDIDTDTDNTSRPVWGFYGTTSGGAPTTNVSEPPLLLAATPQHVISIATSNAGVQAFFSIRGNNFVSPQDLNIRNLILSLLPEQN